MLTEKKPKNDPSLPSNQWERIVRQSMIAAKLSDWHHRNWCVIAVNGIIDSWGFIACETKHEGPPELMHKRHLHKRIGAAADQWWHKSIGKRVQRQ